MRRDLLFQLLLMTWWCDLTQIRTYFALSVGLQLLLCYRKTAGTILLLLFVGILSYLLSAHFAHSDILVFERGQIL